MAAFFFLPTRMMQDYIPLKSYKLPVFALSLPVYGISQYFCILKVYELVLNNRRWQILRFYGQMTRLIY